MPEFHMPVGEDGPDFYSLNAFARGYLEALFFTECHSDNPELEDATFSDLAPHALAKAVGTCVIFQRANECILAEAYASSDFTYGPAEAGRDLWYTTQGHGVGFWDRGLGDIGEKLSQASTRHEVYVYRGDDGRIHLS